MASIDIQTRRLLIVGFGGLLLLLAFTGLNALSVLRSIEVRSETIRRDYFHRDRILEQLRSDIYLSGTYVRDLLLEQNPNLADVHRRELEDVRKRVESNIRRYDAVIHGQEQRSFQQFATGVNSYFESLRPALEWNASQRQKFGYAFMRDSLLPRRMVIVHLADQIGNVNQQQMDAGNQNIVYLFSRFRRWLVLLLVLTLVSGVLLAGGSFHRIVRLEQLSAARFEEVESARGALRELSARLIEIQEADRKSLARELHDEVGQSLSALLLGIGNVAAILPSDGHNDAHAQLYDLRRLAERTVAEVRDMSLLLRPSMLDDLGLIAAVQWQAREVSRRNGLGVQVEADSIPEDLGDEQKTCIYRVTQEALRNIVRHAKAKSVHIRLEQSGEVLALTIQDDGQGFTPEREKGLGLLGMEERVAHLQGSFEIESARKVGTRIRVELPISRAALRTIDQ